MEKIQRITNAECPQHGARLYVVVRISDAGDVELWKGCVCCPGAAILKAEVKVEGEKVD